MYSYNLEYPYFKIIWSAITEYGIRESYNTYKEFEEKLLKYMTEIEIIVLFRVMLTCQNDEEMNLYISNALHRINETELKLELTK